MYDLFSEEEAVAELLESIHSPSVQFTEYEYGHGTGVSCHNPA